MTIITKGARKVMEDDTVVIGVSKGVYSPIADVQILVTVGSH
jgi:hypothetical protein